MPYSGPALSFAAGGLAGFRFKIAQHLVADAGIGLAGMNRALSCLFIVEPEHQSCSQGWVPIQPFLDARAAVGWEF